MYVTVSIYLNKEKGLALVVKEQKGREETFYTEGEFDINTSTAIHEMISTKDEAASLIIAIGKISKYIRWGSMEDPYLEKYLGAKKQVLDTLEHLINMQNKHLELQDKHLELQDKYLSVLSDPVLPIREEEVILEDQTATEPPTMQSVPVKIGASVYVPLIILLFLLFQLFQR